MANRYAVINKKGIVVNIAVANKSLNSSWVECGDNVKKGFLYDAGEFSAPLDGEPIFVYVSLSETSAKLIDDTVSVGYTIKFSEDIESPVDINVPISITDRNGDHVDNVGLYIPANTPTSEFAGEFATNKRGDFTVTNDAINFHESTGMNIINRKLILATQPWLRVYQ
jgi:hypothetical protein